MSTYLSAYVPAIIAVSPYLSSTYNVTINCSWPECWPLCTNISIISNFLCCLTNHMIHFSVHSSTHTVFLLLLGSVIDDKCLFSRFFSQQVLKQINCSNISWFVNLTSQGTTGSSEAHHLWRVLSSGMSPTAQKPDPPYSNDQYVKNNLRIEINKGLSISALKDSTNLLWVALIVKFWRYSTLLVKKLECCGFTYRSFTSANLK